MGHSVVGNCSILFGERWQSESVCVEVSFKACRTGSLLSSGSGTAFEGDGHSLLCWYNKRIDTKVDLSPKA